MKRLNKKAESKGVIFTIIVELAILVAMIPIIANFISLSGDNWVCLDSDFPNLVDESGTNICLNTSLGDVGQANESATFAGASATEIILLGLTILFLVLAFIVVLIRQTGLTKKM